MEQDSTLLEEETVIWEYTQKKKVAHEDLFKGLKGEKSHPSLGRRADLSGLRYANGLDRRGVCPLGTGIYSYHL